MQAGSLGQIGRVVLGVIGGVDAGHRYTEDPIGPDRIDGESCHQGRVDATAESQDHTPEVVLVHVVSKATCQSRVDLLEFGQPFAWFAGRSRRASAELAGQLGDVVVDHGLGQRQIHHEELFGELCATDDHLALGVDHHRVAIEDELILTSDQIHIGDSAAGLNSPFAAESATHVSLVALVWRGVEYEQK